MPAKISLPISVLGRRIVLQIDRRSYVFHVLALLAAEVEFPGDATVHFGSILLTFHTRLFTLADVERRGLRVEFETGEFISEWPVAAPTV
jgi:hypothetical protein